MVIAAGVVLTLASLNVIPAADEGFGAPRWIAALVGLLFVGAGVYVMTMPWTSTAQKVMLGTSIALAFFTVMGIFFTWLTLSAAAGRGTLTVNGVSVPLPDIVGRAMNGVLPGIFAFAFDTLAVWGWWKTFRWLTARAP
jgi:hypothetical protein